MFSFEIKNELLKFDSNEKKQNFLQTFFFDESASTINETKNAKTVVFPNHRGTNKDSWNETKQMALDLNKKNRSVAFLDEHNRQSCADAISFVCGKFQICDFKYSAGCNWNTLQGALVDGFQQANAIILKANIDSGVFKDAINYIKRNYDKHILGDLLIINQYGKILDISKQDIISNRYKIKIKGFFV